MKRENVTKVKSETAEKKEAAPKEEDNSAKAEKPREARAPKPRPKEKMLSQNLLITKKTSSNKIKEISKKAKPETISRTIEEATTAKKMATAEITEEITSSNTTRTSRILTD